VDAARPPRQQLFDAEGYDRMPEQLRKSTEARQVAYLRMLAPPPGLAADTTA